MNPESLLDKYKPAIQYFESMNNSSDNNRVYAESFDEEELEKVDRENTRIQKDSKDLIGSLEKILGDPDLFTSTMMDSPVFSEFYSGFLDGMLDKLL